MLRAGTALLQFLFAEVGASVLAELKGQPSGKGHLETAVLASQSNPKQKL